MQNVVKALIGIIILSVSFSSCQKSETDTEFSDLQKDEVIYHVFQRSFFDSNGDEIGDLNGLRMKLDYLQDLGVTSILLLPLYQSVYYHNYFSSDFEKIDPEFGSREDYLDLVKEVHKRGMKLYMDMETQYVTENHIWYKDSYGNPSSKYSNYLVYQGPNNTKPEPIVYDLTELTGYDSTTRKVATVNLNNPDVWKYNLKLFSHWVDPNNDGKFDDGVDGFRIDHMMDDLDNKGLFTHLFTKFWRPLFDSLRQINPKIQIIAEQADWGSTGVEFLKEAGVDKVFSFGLKFAFSTFDKKELTRIADTVFQAIPENSDHIVFIENHDTDRFASTVKQNPGKLRIGAALNLLIGGTPSIYYGQELGMTGMGGFEVFNNTDGNDIPRREAFEWFAKDEGNGMAIWYRNSGPWWDKTNLKPNDGISLEEEKSDKGSLWHYYKNLISLRKSYPELVVGKYKTLPNDNDHVFSFLRFHEGEGILVAVNLSDEVQKPVVDLTYSPVRPGGQNPKRLMAIRKARFGNNEFYMNLRPYEVQIWKVR